MTNQTYFNDGSAPPPPREPVRMGTGVAAVVIALSVAGLLVERQLRPERREVATTQPGDVPKASLQMRLAARQAVGAAALFGAQARSAAAVAPAIMQLDKTAKSPADRLRSIIVSGELEGANVALGRLGSFDPGESPPLREDAATLRTIYDEGPDAPGPARRDALAERHGWFGQVALSHGLPNDDPRRVAALRPAARTAAVLVAASIAILVALVAGLVLLILGIVLFATGTLRPAYRPPARAPGRFLEAFAFYLAWFIGISLFARAQGTRSSMTWFWGVLAALAPLACLWPMFRGLGFRETLAGLGWHRGRGVWREAGAGVLGYLAGLPVVALGLFISAMLSRATGVEASHPIVESIRADFLTIVILLALASVYAPLAEETMFRGAFYGGLRAWLRPLAGALVVSFVFAVIHPQGWVGLPTLAAIALVLNAQREWRGSIIAPVVSHGINNGTVVILLVMVVG